MLREGNIVLRRLTIGDKQSLAMLANNKKIWDNVRDYLPFPYTLQDAEIFINHYKNEDVPTVFAIEFDGRFCGVIGLVKQSDVYKLTAEIGYWLGEPFWGKGIATTAVKLMTQYGFDTLKLVRIHTGIFEYNIASMHVLEKNNFEKDGIFKKSILKNGKIWDEHRFSKINEDHY